MENLKRVRPLKINHTNIFQNDFQTRISSNNTRKNNDLSKITNTRSKFNFTTKENKIKNSKSNYLNINNNNNDKSKSIPLNQKNATLNNYISIYKHIQNKKPPSNINNYTFSLNQLLNNNNYNLNNTTITNNAKINNKNKKIINNNSGINQRIVFKGDIERNKKNTQIPMNVNQKNNNKFLNMNKLKTKKYTSGYNINKNKNEIPSDVRNININQKVFPLLKNNKKSLDNTIKNNGMINKYIPNILINDIKNQAINKKKIDYNIINNFNNTTSVNIVINNISNTRVMPLSSINSITEYPKTLSPFNYKINCINNMDDINDSFNMKYIFETDKVKIMYDNETGNKIVNEFLFQETIGRGAYSKVKKCINLHTNEEFAVKILNKRLLRKKKKSYGKTKEGTLKINYMIDDALNEIEIYKAFQQTNQNVIKLYQIINDTKKDKTYLIMELASKGPLVSLNDKTGTFCINKNYNDNIYDEKLIKKWILDIANGLKFIHENNIVHRDIKSDNILIDKNGNCKIADFGCSIKLKDGQPDLFSKTEGNMFFFPPEFVDGKNRKQFGYKPVDIWAFGVSIYTCIFKTLPFLPENRENVVELFKEIREAKIDYNKNGVRISKEMRILLSHILEKEPKKRFTAKDIVEYPWLYT